MQEVTKNKAATDDLNLQKPFYSDESIDLSQDLENS